MLKQGDEAPDFELPDQDGKPTRLTDLLADGRLILFFYPADFTPVCTREACMFGDAHAELAARGMTVAGISPNDSDSHRRFRDRHGLNYTLLADPDKQAIRAYGVDGPFGLGVRRTTFVIDRERRIQAAVNAELRLSVHRRLLEQALAIES